MIEIRIDKDLGMIRAEGHAGHGKKGQDIVCAAVSAVMDMVARAAMHKKDARVETEEDGTMAVWGFGFRYSCVLSAAREELEAIAEKYPENVSVKDVRYE
ncbi:MAG: ribosomal-processing cysteine protease Prp [Clostridia bacterium]|nr:ribosomal-processing cysteine protease Prp [Clostridia bacterium]